MGFWTPSIPTDLVVLSGCETALGKNLRGKGSWGSPTAFSMLAPHRLLATLWPVEDQATAELIQRFYHGLLHDGLRPSAALRQAQTEMRLGRRWHLPNDWAAFVLQGDWSGWGG